jgi:hypothetical protein
VDPLPATVIAFCLAVLFASAAGAKLLDIGRFRDVLAGYRVLPPRIVPVFAWLVPTLEALLALGWLAQPGLTVAASSAALLSIYAAAIAVNLLRGRTDISCGCSFGNTDRVSWWLVARNSLIALAALGPGVPTQAGRALQATDYLVAGAATLAAIVLYLAGRQLMANGTTVAAWRDSDGAR